MMAAKNTEVASSRRRGGTAANKWTDATAPAPAETEQAEPTQKLSMEFPISAHRALKGGAGFAGTSMVAALVEMVRARYLGAPWPDDVVEQVKAQIGYQEPSAVAADSVPAAKARTARTKRGA